MIEVKLFGLVDGQDTQIGSILWDGRQPTLQGYAGGNPELLQELLSQTITVPNQNGYSTVTFQQDPEKYLRSLDYKFSSPYFRAAVADQSQGSGPTPPVVPPRF